MEVGEDEKLLFFFLGLMKKIVLLYKQENSQTRCEKCILEPYLCLVVEEFNLRL